MPNIKTYTSETNGLQPTETGIDALVQSGRRIAGLYSEAGQAKQQQGALWNKTAESVGGMVEKIAAHQDIHRESKASADLMLDAQQQWDAIVKDPGFDPNDRTVAQKFMERLEPSLGKLSQGALSDRGQQFAEHLTEQLRTHWQQKTISDMSNAAGEAAVRDTTQAINTWGAIVTQDASSLPLARKMVELKMEQITASSPMLTGEKAQTIKTRLMEDANKKLTQAAIEAKAKDNPDAAERMAQDPANTKYLPPAESMKIIDDIRRERKADWLLAKQMQAEQLRKASEANKDKFLKNFYDPDTPPEQKMTSRDVRDIPDGQVTPETRKHMFEMIQHAAERGPVDPAVSKRNTLDLIIGVRNGSINDMKDIDQSLANHDIDYNGFKLVEGEFLGRKTPEGQRLADLRARFMATYGNSVNPQNASGIKLAEGNKREYDLYSYIRRKEESVPPSQREDLYEPTSPNFIGKTPYARPMSPWEQSKLLDERTANSRKKPQAVEVPPPPREYPDATWDENARKYKARGPDGLMHWVEQ